MGLTEPTPFDWRGLTAAEPEALAAASNEVEMYVRALAAHGVVVDRDAIPSELEDRQGTIRSKIWPSEPLDGFGLHASLGAYLVTRVAVDLVPTGHLGLRPEHLSSEGLRAALIDQGLLSSAADAVVGDWGGEPDGFQGDPAGLSLSILAGLAARTLTRDERNQALAQVAASPRDLARLAAATNLLMAVRRVLPLLPIPSLGAVYDLAVVGLTIGRGDRVAGLIARPGDVLEAALHELGAASAALRAGAPYQPDLDVQVVVPTAMSTDSIVEDVSESIEIGPLAALCRWRDGSLRPEDVESWRHEMSRWRATEGTLGLRMPVPAPRVMAAPLPPAAALVRRSILPHTEDGTDRIELEAPPYAWRGDPLDAIAPVVRGAIRMVAAATEGEPPPPGALTQAGDLSWLVRRAAALAAVVKGDLHDAVEVTKPMPYGSAPERRWAQDRLRRFGDRVAEPAESSEARPKGAALIDDLAQQLARTITGKLPPERRE